MTTRATISLPVLAIIILAGPLSAPGYAETDADFSKYCRNTFPNSGPVTRAPSGKLAHYCNQRGTLQGIDLARACELTTGSRNYRKLGDRVLCEDGSGASSAASVEPLNAADYVRYCRTKFPNSIYQDVPGNFGSRHHCRRPGGPIGFTLQPIDLADLCRTLKNADEYRKEAGRIVCVTSEKPQSAERRATGAGAGGASRDQQSPDAPRPSPPGADNSEPAGEGNEAGKSGSSKTADGNVSGVWEWTTQSLRAGLKVRFDVTGNQVTGRIEEIPAKLASVLRNYDNLSVGDVFFVGKFDGEKLTGKSRIGIMGASHTVKGQFCYGFVANLERDRSKWMPIEVRRKGDTLIGRHKVVGLTGHKYRACATQRIPDTPPRIKAGYAIVELKQTGCRLPDPNLAFSKYHDLVANTRAQAAGAKQ